MPTGLERPFWHRFTRGTIVDRLVVIFLGVLSWSISSPGVDAEVADRNSPAMQASRELSSTFRQCMAQLNTENQKALAEAGQAFVTFAQKDWVSMTTTGLSGLPTMVIDEVGVRRLHERRAHLISFFLDFRYPYGDSPIVRKALDAELEDVYAKSLKLLDADAAQRLREAQRAWIVYRDLDADAAVLAARQAKRPPLRGYAAKANLTALRTKQLKQIYLREGRSQILAEEFSSSLKPPDSSAEIGWTEQFAKDVAALLDSICSEKRENFFQTPTSVKELGPVDPTVEHKINELQKRLSEKGSYTVQHSLAGSKNHVSEKMSSYHLLRIWVTFSSFLRQGDPEAAARALPGAKFKPATLPAEYSVIWDSILKWEEFFVSAFDTYKQHIKRARSLDDLGKVSEAIREYDAAFALFENPQIAKDVKALRKRSLGL